MQPVPSLTVSSRAVSMHVSLFSLEPASESLRSKLPFAVGHGGAVPTPRLLEKRVAMTVSQPRSHASAVALPFRLVTMTVAVTMPRFTVVVTRAPRQALQQLSSTVAALRTHCFSRRCSRSRTRVRTSTSYCHDHLSTLQRCHGRLAT